MVNRSLIVTEIERSAIHDGPGIRTVVFLKGCPLQCFWCCNPETQSLTTLLFHDEKKCTSCGRCVEACSHDAVSLSNGKVVLNRTSCQTCGDCVSACPTGADTLVGREMTIEEIIDIVSRDMEYYLYTGGGLTLSGGEPLFQSSAVDLLSKAKERGISTFVESAAAVPWEQIERATHFTDGFYIDYKHSDAAVLEQATGANLEQIENNLIKLTSLNIPFTLRTPVIPGFNNHETVIRKSFSFARALKRTNYILLPYHNLGANKYEKMGRMSPMPGVAALKPDSLKEFVKIGEEYGLHVQIGS